MHAAVILRRFLHGEFQQRKILAAGFAAVRMVIQLYSRNGDLAHGALAVGAGEDFVDGMDPLPAAAAVDLFIPEHHAFSAVGLKTPGVAVTGLLGLRRPGLLQSGPPSGVKDFV